MKCDRLLVERANRRDLHERRSFPGRDIVHLFGRGVISPRSSVSAAVRWDIRRLVDQSRIRHYRSNHRVGTCSRMVNNSGTAIPHRETPFRPGPHPSCSECHSSGLQYIIINQQISSSDLSHPTTTHTADSVNENDVRFLVHDTIGLTGPSSIRTTDRSTISARRDSGRVENTQTGPPVNRLKTMIDDHVDDTILQISGTGHWFLKGWIGDHSVESGCTSWIRRLVTWTRYNDANWRASSFDIQICSPFRDQH